MRAPDSIETMVLELQALMQKNYDAGVSVRFWPEPGAVVRGAAVVVRARIFAPASALAALNPVLGCKEVEDFGDRPFENGKRGPDFRDFSITLQTRSLKRVKSLHLTLHPSRGADAIAQCPVYIFGKGAVVAAKRELRVTLWGRSSGNAAASGRRRR